MESIILPARRRRMDSEGLGRRLEPGMVDGNRDRQRSCSSNEHQRRPTVARRRLQKSGAGAFDHLCISYCQSYWQQQGLFVGPRRTSLRSERPRDATRIALADSELQRRTPISKAHPHLLANASDHGPGWRHAFWSKVGFVGLGRLSLPLHVVPGTPDVWISRRVHLGTDLGDGAHRRRRKQAGHHGRGVGPTRHVRHGLCVGAQNA